MSMARHRVKGECPEEVFVVTNGTSHRLYSKLSAARSVRTRENGYLNEWQRANKPAQYKIMQAVVEDWEEVE